MVLDRTLDLELLGRNINTVAAKRSIARKCCRFEVDPGSEVVFWFHVLTFMASHLFHFSFADIEQYWLFILSFFKTWDQKLTPGLRLLTFMTVHQMNGQLILAITGPMLLVFMTTHPFQ